MNIQQRLKVAFRIATSLILVIVIFFEFFKMCHTQRKIGTFSSRQTNLPDQYKMLMKFYMLDLTDQQ